jgi:hypothetical protein
MRPLTYQDEARLEYTRLLWRKPAMRERLLRHWSDARHPSRERFFNQWKPLVERLLASPPRNDVALDADLRSQGKSLRVVAKEIPPVFGSFWRDSLRQPV